LKFEVFCSDLAEDHYDQSKHPFDALQRRTAKKCYLPGILTVMIKYYVCDVNRKGQSHETWASTQQDESSATDPALYKGNTR